MKDKTFEQRIAEFKELILQGKVKITPEMVEKLKGVFTASPNLKLNKIQKAKPKRKRGKGKVYHVKTNI